MGGASEPPSHIAPAKLFRLLLQRPRARVALAYRFAGAEHVRLFVRALRSGELGEAFDAADHLPIELQGSRAMLELVARALVLEGGERVFVDGLAVAELLEGREADRLALEVCQALAWISPTYARSDTAAWHRVLVTGARDGANLHDAYTLGRCVDVALGSGFKQVTHRPDRYFGGAIADITDGQWMAFRAARSLVEEASKSGTGQ